MIEHSHYVNTGAALMGPSYLPLDKVTNAGEL